MKSWLRVVLVLTAGATTTMMTACGGGSSNGAAAPSASGAPAETATAIRRTQDAQIVFLETRAAGDPLDTFSLNALALAHIQRSRDTGDVAELAIAAELLERSLAVRRADNYQGLALYGAVKVTQHDFAEGLALAREAIEQVLDEAFAYGVLGDAHMGLGQYDDADVAYERMVGIEPALPAFGRRALLFQVRGRTDEAEQSWLSAIERADPAVPENAAWAHAQLANLYFMLGRLDNADEHYNAALAAFPGYVHALAGTGRVAAAREDYATAIERYTDAIERVPLPEYVIALGDVYAASGDMDAAQQQYDLVAAIEQLYAANGVNLDLQIALFNADHQRDVPATLERARVAYAEQPSVAAADVLAWVEFNAGNIAEAQTAIEAALQTGIIEPSILYHAGMIYRAAGDDAGARELLSRVVDTTPAFHPLHGPAAAEALAELDGG